MLATASEPAVAILVATDTIISPYTFIETIIITPCRQTPTKFNKNFRVILLNPPPEPSPKGKKAQGRGETANKQYISNIRPYAMTSTINPHIFIAIIGIKRLNNAIIGSKKPLNSSTYVLMSCVRAAPKGVPVAATSEIHLDA